MAVMVAMAAVQVVGGIAKLFGKRKKRKKLAQARKFQRANTVENFLRERRRFQRAGRAAMADVAIAAVGAQEGGAALQGSVMQAQQQSIQTQMVSRIGDFEDQERRNRIIEQLGQEANRADQRGQMIGGVADTAADVLGIWA